MNYKNVYLFNLYFKRHPYFVMLVEKGKVEYINGVIRRYNAQKDKQGNGQKLKGQTDRQWSIKHYSYN